MRSMRIVLVAALVTAWPSATADAQRRTERARADSLVTSALATAEAGDTTAALILLDSARKADDRFAPAHYHRGILLARTSEMGFIDLVKRQAAVNALTRAIELDGANPWALLELGRLRLKMPFMRIAAEALFDKALKVAKGLDDPTALATVHFEIAQIYDRRFRAQQSRYNFIGNATILDPIAAQHDRWYVKNFLELNASPVPDAGELDFGKAEGSYRAALTADPAHELSAAALCIMLYEAERFEEMADVARRSSTAAPKSARIRFALGLALLRQGRREQAIEELEAAHALLTDREQQMVTSLSPILRQRDARAYELLGTKERAAGERAYWEMADPLMLTTVNEARLAFLGRAAYADLMFSTPDLGIRGALTDRGQIVIRYGEPPIVATFAPDVAWTDNAESMAKVTTLWYYPESEIRFVFVGPPAFSSAWFAGDFKDYATQLRSEEPVRYDALPGGLTVDSIPIQVARFRGDRMLATRVEIYAGIPTNRLAADADLATVPVETAFLVLDGARKRVVDERDTIIVRSSAAKSPVRGFERDFQPGDYAVRIEALEPQANRGARGLGTVSILSFPSESFSVSDLLVGTNLSSRVPTPTRRGDVNLDVVADLTVDPGEALGLYWETYGAKPSADGMYRLSVEISMTILELDRAKTFQARLFGGIVDALRLSAEGDEAVSITFPRSMPISADGNDRVAHHLSLALEGAPPAEYLLELKVTDLESGRVARTSRHMNIRRPPQ
jgi:GWxTD domain-containing protein